MKLFYLDAENFHLILKIQNLFSIPINSKTNDMLQLQAYNWTL